jgi:hypothetical protein
MLAGLVRSGGGLPGEMLAGLVRSGALLPGEMLAGLVRSGGGLPGEMLAGLVRSGAVLPGEVSGGGVSDGVRPGAVWAGRVLAGEGRAWLGRVVARAGPDSGGLACSVALPGGRLGSAGCWAGRAGMRERARRWAAAGAGVPGAAWASALAWARASSSGAGLDTSLARIAALMVILMPGIALPAAQKIIGHQGAGSHDIAADSAAIAPSVCWLARPAAANSPSLVPPR